MNSKVASLPFIRGHPLYGPSLKIKRAERHLRDAMAEVAAFFARCPYEIGITTDAESGNRTYYVTVREEIPDDLCLQIGDVVHNLRSAFDLLACQVVGLGTGSVSQAQFPVCSSAEKFDAKVSHYVPGASQHAIDVINRFQPYHGTQNRALWLIHKLDILDKHRMIVPVGAVHRNIGVNNSAIFSRMIGSEITVPTLFLVPKDRKFPLKDGSAILTIGPKSDGDVEPDYQVTFEISFGEPEAIRGEPISPLLDHLVSFTADAIYSFSKEVFV